MSNKLRTRKPSLLLASVFALPILFITLSWLINRPAEEPDHQADSNSGTIVAEQESEGKQIDLVNPEEKNSLLKLLRLPYEDDSVAITHKKSKSSPYGVVIYVIDKQNATFASSDARALALRYIKSRASPEIVQKINVSYVGINDAP